MGGVGGVGGYWREVGGCQKSSSQIEKGDGVREGETETWHRDDGGH